MAKKGCPKGGSHTWVQFESSRLGPNAMKCSKCGATTSPVKKIRKQGMK